MTIYEKAECLAPKKRLWNYGDGVMKQPQFVYWQTRKYHHYRIQQTSEGTKYHQDKNPSTMPPILLRATPNHMQSKAKTETCSLQNMPNLHSSPRYSRRFIFCCAIQIHPTFTSATT